MATYEQLKEKNPHVKWITVTDEEFAPYGRVLDLDCSVYVDALNQQIPMPEKGAYEASNPILESFTKEKEMISNKVYGQMPIEVGYCAGHNTSMNAMEWHHGSEVNVAATDLVLLLGKFGDVKQQNGEYSFDSKDVVAVFVPKGTAIEVYSMVLHFCPIAVDDAGFSTLVILPDKTNTPLTAPTDDKYLVVINKWLIGHVSMGKPNSCITGENIKITY